VTARRWPWLASAGLLLAAAVAAGWSAYLHWLPCRGTMLNGSIVRGYAYGPDFSDACLRRMDGGMPFLYPPELAEQSGWASHLGVLATGLAALAWLALVIGSPWGLLIKVVGAVPGLLTLGLAGLVARMIERPDRGFEAPISVGVLIELLTVLAVMVIYVRAPMDGPTTAALLAVAWGSTAFVGMHQMFEYAAMSTFSDANWDVPPGTGYLTAAGLLLAGAFTLAYGIRRPGSSGRPQELAEVSLLDRRA
jgi:hypothetical protein